MSIQGRSPSIERPPAARILDSLVLYRHLVAAQLRSQMQYKVSFLLGAFAVFLGTVIDFLAILILFARFSTLGGWQLPEVALLYGLVNLPFALVHLVAEGLEDFQSIVRPGAFDQILVRPRTALLQVLGSRFPLRQLGRLVSAGLALGLALHWLDALARWGWPQWAFMLLTMAGGMAFFSGVVLLSATACFWTVESIEVANIVTYGGTEMASYPMHIFAGWLRRTFTYILPLAFVNYYPALWLLNRRPPPGLPDLSPFLSLPVCLWVLGLGLLAWRIGVRHYFSTGS
jgi:ABC-2 type transport system permease protein